MAAGQDLVKTIQGDFDLAPLQKMVKNGASVDEVHALITNKCDLPSLSLNLPTNDLIRVPEFSALFLTFFIVRTLLKYAFWLVVANAVTVIAARQSIRGRNPVYTILASLACVFLGTPSFLLPSFSSYFTHSLAPTLFPLLTGNPITWIQNDNTVRAL